MYLSLQPEEPELEVDESDIAKPQFSPEEEQVSLPYPKTPNYFIDP